MLRDRKVLVEAALEKAKQAAASLYFKLAVYESKGDGSVPPNMISAYTSVKETVANLEFDLTCINSLIAEGHK